MFFAQHQDLTCLNAQNSISIDISAISIRVEIPKTTCFMIVITFSPHDILMFGQLLPFSVTVRCNFRMSALAEAQQWQAALQLLLQRKAADATSMTASLGRVEGTYHGGMEWLNVIDQASYGGITTKQFLGFSGNIMKISGDLVRQKMLLVIVKRRK